MNNYQAVIGLEVHAALQTRSKMFCGCPIVDATLAEPNTSVCEICTGMPGTLPMINSRAVEYAIRVALALHCTIAETSVFARKNYFYPDLPKGFQISQYELPLAQHGSLTINTPQGQKEVRIRRAHLEEDTGKLTHSGGHSLVDYNRSGVPLLEIVSEPDMNSVEEVKAYATKLRSLLRYLKVNSGDMEKGIMRFEANVSVRQQGSAQLGTRTEIKNLNSFRSLTHGVAYEIERQSRLLDKGKSVKQETLGWDDVRGETYSQRSKEEECDYRYFPEPDLPPLFLDPTYISQIKASLPELPDAKQDRFTHDYHLSPYIASVLTAEREVADYFESAVAAVPSLSPVTLSKWLSGEFFALLHHSGQSIEETRIEPAAFARLVALVSNDTISASSGKAVLSEMFENGKYPEKIVADRELAQISEPSEIDRLVSHILESNPSQVSQYLDGKITIQDWFFGQVMRATQGRANPTAVRSCLEKHLKELKDNPASE